MDTMVTISVIGAGGATEEYITSIREGHLDEIACFIENIVPETASVNLQHRVLRNDEMTGIAILNSVMDDFPIKTSDNKTVMLKLVACPKDKPQRTHSANEILMSLMDTIGSANHR